VSSPWRWGYGGGGCSGGGSLSFVGEEENASPPSVCRFHSDQLLTSSPRIVRDYEKYISRQLSRGASRQELNLSWLKKNEMDIKRHVSELRETIKQNWSTTGRELRDEFKNYWAPSPRPANGRDMYQFGSSSGASNGNGNGSNGSNGNGSNGNGSNGNGRTSQDGHAPEGLRSPKINPNWEHLGTPSRPQSPQTEFANGFSLGLIGGVRSWVS
jgi:choline-phosphate cytidylyltransferase